MKNIYKITKGQLVVLWVFVIIVISFLAYQFNEYCYISEVQCKEGGSVFPIIILSFLIMFYTLGWKNFRSSK